MSLLSFAGLPFSQQFILVLIQSVIPILLIPVSLWVMFRYMPQIMDLMHTMIKGLTKTERDYLCNCSRCRAELRTKKGLKEFKRYLRREKRFDKEDLI